MAHRFHSISDEFLLSFFSLQYPEGHISRSIYATFKIISAPPPSCHLLEEFFPELCLAIWTTTPWTIPANAGKIFVTQNV